MPSSLVRRSALVAPLVLAGLAAGCGTGGTPSPGSPSIEPATSSPVAASPTTTPVASASGPAAPTPVPADTLTEPPAAALVGETLPGTPVAGALGSFTWVDEGSDSPWIVPPTGVAAAPGIPVSVAFDPPAAASSWIARWAPVTATGAGDVDTFAEGTEQVTIVTPDTPGAWSLQVEARFGEGWSATWYWRVDVE